MRLKKKVLLYSPDPTQLGETRFALEVMDRITVLAVEKPKHLAAWLKRECPFDGVILFAPPFFLEDVARKHCMRLLVVRDKLPMSELREKVKQLVARKRGPSCFHPTQQHLEVA
jgi:hypothetical protein